MLDFEHMTLTNKKMTYMKEMLPNWRLCSYCKPGLWTAPNIKSNGHFCWVLKRLIISNNTKKSHCAIIYWAAAVAGAEPEIYWMAYKYITTGEPPKLYREEGSPNSQVEEEVRNNYSWLNTRTYGKNAERLTLILISRYLAQHSLNCLFLWSTICVSAPVCL